jgi:Uma2 family endonuclease
MMSTPPDLAALPALPPDPSPRLLTAADLAVLPTELPSGPVRYELHHGRLITMTPPGDIHGAVEGNLIAALKSQGEYRGHGKARCGDVGIVLSRNPDVVVGADAVFLTNASLPVRRTSEGYLETIPDLVVEVRSKNDTLPALQRRAQEYLDAGVRVVWMADPFDRNVTEYRPGTAPRAFGEPDTLTIDDLIPGFALLVRDALQD